MAYRGQGQKVQKRSRIQVWLYEQVNMRIEGCIIGFDEYMNLVLDDAEEIHSKTKSRKQLEIWRAGKAWSRAQLLFAIFQEVLSISYVRKQMMASFSCPHPGQGAPTKVLLDFINSGTVPQDSAHPRRPFFWAPEEDKCPAAFWAFLLGCLRDRSNSSLPVFIVLPVLNTVLSCVLCLVNSIAIWSVAVA
ncbi:small nuclear ribonucleoprotein E isoform X4 [Acinonyx jubatus]|uniref:Small nuclear ribonucleoprotein E n=1 Tax=Acinonyx jubatus TaxID=32536 RepID=A0ABM3P247_ACIJB|nr:small nuclear ribonucleoprotein E isoform X4 [Acinonyx jubatus]